MLPAIDAALFPGGALGLDLTARARRGPVALDLLTRFRPCGVMWQAFTGRALILVRFLDVLERRTIELPLGLVRPGLGLRYVGNETGQLTVADLFAVVVTLIGHHLELLGAQDCFGLLGYRRQLPAVTTDPFTVTCIKPVTYNVLL